MLRTRFSKILLSDLTDLPERIPGNHILLSHGNSVSRGDLITLENITGMPGTWTITINKDNFSQLCTVGNPGSLPGYTVNYDAYRQQPKPCIITGTIATDLDGIYVSNYGSDSTGWHGPVFYATLPLEIGKLEQYWHIVFKFITDYATTSLIYANFRAGFSAEMHYRDGAYYDSEGTLFGSNLYNSSSYAATGGSNIYPTIGVNTNHEFKFYHYVNNTTKTYRDGVLMFDNTDPLVLNKGNNMLTCLIMQYTEYLVPYFRIYEITVSTDPTYDPLP